MKKSPWLSAILNFIFFGGGYIYNGKRKGFGLALVLAWLVIRYADIQFYLNGTVMNHWLVLMAGLAVLQFTFAVNGFREAKELNAGK